MRATNLVMATVTKILPKKGERNILITSALPYLNNVPRRMNVEYDSVLVHANQWILISFVVSWL